MSLREFLGSADNFTAVIVASVIIWGTMRALYRRTIGSKRDLRRKLDHLACGNPTEYVESQFGPSVHRSRTSAVVRREHVVEKVEQRVYSTKYGWLTVHFIEDAVVGYAFTATYDFPYDLGVQSFGGLQGKMWRAAFKEIAQSAPCSGELYVGASQYNYTEVHYFGKAGRYQYYALSVTMTGGPRRSNWFGAASPQRWGVYNPEHGHHLDDQKSREAITSLGALREVKPDTFAVFAADYMFARLNGADASGTINHDQMLLLDRASAKQMRRGKVPR